MRFFASAQGDTKVPFGGVGLAAQQGDLTGAGVRTSKIWIEHECAREAAFRRVVIARAERKRSETELDVGIVRRQRTCSRKQARAFVRVAALVAQHAEQMQRVGIVGMFDKLRAIALFGFVEAALTVQINRFLEHVGSQ